MKKIVFFCSLLFAGSSLFSQIDSTLLLKRVPGDSLKHNSNMDAMYNRPFLRAGKLPVSLGGYVEANWQHISTDGITEGHQFQFRRLSLFVASSIARRIKFLTEIEFENDPHEAAEGKPTEIGIEYAALDIEFHPLLNLRSGIIVNPIGAFNQNHDGPKWEFTDRPIAMTQLLPDTWSNTGFGLYGKHYSNSWMFGYEVYATGGFDNSIIDNDRGKTFLPESRENSARFASIDSGEPLITAKITGRYSKIGELGISYMGQAYNKTMEDGLVIDTKRRLDVLAFDFNTSIPKLHTAITAEWAMVNVQLPDDYIESYGKNQQGGFIDIVQPVFKHSMLGWKEAVINVACRVEYADWNVGRFEPSKQNMGDEVWSVVPAISFRPTPQTVLRFNYRYLQATDFLGNGPSYTQGFSLGISSYF